MARARGIKPGFFKNEELVELPFEARLLFIGLWTLADREGRTEDRPKRIKMEIFPADSVDVDSLLSQLAATGMLLRYSHDGERFLQIVNFVRHQNPHRDERPSTIPAPGFGGEPESNAQASQDKHGASTVQAQCDTSTSTMPLGLTPCILTPDSRLLIPDSPTNTHTTSLSRESAGQPTGATRAGAVCVVLKSEGIGAVNPSHPELLALLARGAEVGQFSDAARIAVKKKKPNFAYVLGIVARQLADVAELAAAPASQPGAGGSAYESGYQRSQRERVAAFAPAIAKKAPGAPEPTPVPMPEPKTVTMEASHVAVTQGH